MLRPDASEGAGAGVNTCCGASRHGVVTGEVAAQPTTIFGGSSGEGVSLSASYLGCMDGTGAAVRMG